MRVASQRSSRTIAALVPNVLGFSPGQRVRIELWAQYLRDAGWKVEFFPFEDEALHEVLYNDGRPAAKVSRLFECYWNQFDVVSRRLSADVVFIYREASLIGPALLERIAARKNIPIILDIDDPVFIPYRSPINNWASLLKFSRKTHTLFRLSTHIIAINKLLGDYASSYNTNVSVIPNCVDTDRYFPLVGERAGREGTKLVWIGSKSTMQNLAEIADPLRELQSKYNAPLLVVGSGSADLGLDQLETRQWSPDTEVSDLQEGEIGLLPLNDLPWNKWKFFYKTVQYMAIGIPVVARRMGSNAEIIEDGVNGFLVETKQEWFDRLSQLIGDSSLRKEMGKAARATVEAKYSIKSQMPRLVDIFENVVASNTKRDRSE